MNVKLVRLSYDYKKQLCEMMEEWLSIEKDFSPYVIRKNDYHDFDNYLNKLENGEDKDGLVPDSTFFLLDLDRNIFLGAVNIRHYMNDRLIGTGGHIGDGVRPSERRKGYATKMIALALEECKKLGIYDVLITCSKDNIGSYKSITNNGFIYENEIPDGNEICCRFWKHLKNDVDLSPLKEEELPNFVEMSKAAFATDVLVGGKPGDIPPGADSYKWHEERFHEGTLFSFKKNNEFVGGAILFPNEKEQSLYLGRLFIDPNHFNEHLGYQLLSEIENYYPFVKTVYLDTPEWNKRTNHFYKRYGYVFIKKEKDFLNIYKKTLYGK